MNNSKKVILALSLILGISVSIFVISGEYTNNDEVDGEGQPEQLDTTPIVTGVDANITTTYSEENFGEYNSEHVHAAFMIRINGNLIDFSQEKYQIKSRFMHVENNDGTTVHRHASGVPFGYFLESLGIAMDENGCIVIEDGERYCNQEENQIRFFLNSEEYDSQSILDYVVQDGDRILVSYGNHTMDSIERELNELQQITIITTGSSGQR